jgi:signal transduction histidine kinase
VRASLDRVLSLVTWKGVAIVAAFSFINALRRNANSRLLWEDTAEWWIDVANATLTGIFVSVPIVIAVIAAVRLLPLNGWRLMAMLVVVVASSALLGTLLLIAWEGVDEGYTFVRAVGGTWPRYFFPGLMFAGACVYFRRKSESQEAMRRVESDRAQLEQRMTEARLSVLQAQIEPHFLFNTLAAVKRLYRTDSTAAASTLDNLIHYLTVALPQIRQVESTLGREATLVEAYLNIHRIRMGRRLTFRIDVPAPLQGERVPPMMLLTLVENAIKHGLAPLPGGGFIHLSARSTNGRLCIEVADSGRGFISTSGAGTGLANLRARLAAQYGSAGALTLAINAPRGVVARLTLPASAEPASSLA